MIVLCCVLGGVGSLVPVSQMFLVHFSVDVTGYW